MKCSACGTHVAVLKPGRPIRCNKCGSVLGANHPEKSPAHEDSSIPSVAHVTPSRFRRRWLAIASLAFVAILSIWIFLRREQLVSALPFLGGVLVPNQHGFGDTILRYRDRTYEGAKWEKLPESEAASVMAAGPGRDGADFRAIRGWDDENYYVTTGETTAMMFRVKDGIWSKVGDFKDSCDQHVLRLESRDRILFACSCAWDGALWEVTAAGIRRVYDLRQANTCQPNEIALIAPDLYLTTTVRPLLRVTDGRVESLEPEQGRKELYLHTRQNVPLKNFGVDKLRLARAVAPGTVYSFFENTGFGEDREHRIGVFDSGLWYEAGRLPNNQPIDMWLGLDNNEPFVVLVGRGGWVHIKTKLDQAGFDQSLNTGVEATSGDLIRVWGVSPQKYWVMDHNGTVWERAAGNWRVVVRGLRREDVAFGDAWVSPSGNAYAISKKHIYRLK